ncbi:MAG TPA: hypothetical protein DCF62_05785 [Porticoccaceae bacterium]|nr:hypothetical protein [Porticoccaceae bacterium]
MLDKGPELLHEELNSILVERRLGTHFQPIVSLSRQALYGYEGLIRGPSNSALHSPEKLFSVAEHYGRHDELDFLCRETIIRQFVELNLPGRLFLNINPVALMSSGYRQGMTALYLRKYGLNPNRIVIEITETQPIEDYQLIRAAIEHYREEGFIIALDDLGAGYAGLKLWSELRPDFVKVDRHFISGIDTDNVKRQFVNHILEISRSTSCTVIAEGIETGEEYATVRKLGADFAQGYYFARPKADPIRCISADLFRNGSTRPSARSKYQVGSLLKPMSAIESTCTVNQAADIFMHSPDIPALAVLVDKQPMGILIRSRFMEMIAHRYGRELHGKKPVYVVAEKNVLAFDVATSLEVVSKRLTHAIDVYVDEFILVEDGELCGKGTLLDLLQAITLQQIETARYANPLTMLPGNVPIMQEVHRRLESMRGFVVVYCDLDNFKAYNDTYGFAMGDEIILALGKLLNTHCSTDEHFAGHIGGDDFIVLMGLDGWQEKCQGILRDFKQDIQRCYRMLNSGSDMCDTVRTGETAFSRPLITLSMGAVVVAEADFPLTYEDISTAASAAKSRAKKVNGDAFVFVSPAASQADSAVVSMR